jgi:hypothetical protein
MSRAAATCGMNAIWREPWACPPAETSKTDG